MKIFYCIKCGWGFICKPGIAFVNKCANCNHEGLSFVASENKEEEKLMQELVENIRKLPSKIQIFRPGFGKIVAQLLKRPVDTPVIQKIIINLAMWNIHGRYIEKLEDINYCKALVGKQVKITDMREGHFWVGLVTSLFWDSDTGTHMFDIQGDEDSEEEGYIEISDIASLEALPEIIPLDFLIEK